MGSRFTSARERRLWLWTAAVVIAIFSTLGLARTLSDELRNRGLFDDVFFFAFVLLVAIVVVRALSLGRSRSELFALAVTAIVYLMAFLRMASPIERSHLLEYGVVALLVYEALSERASNGAPVRWPALIAIALTAVVGTLDECVQLAIPSRVFDPIDIAFNALAAFMAVSSTLAIRFVRQRSQRRA